MLYVSDITHITSLPKTLSEEDKTVIFCTANADLPIGTVRTILSLPCSITLEEISDKEDMLVCLGALLSEHDSCTYLIPDLPVPKRFENKVKTKRTRSTTKTRTRKTAKKVESKLPKIKTDPAPSDSHLATPKTSVEKANVKAEKESSPPIHNPADEKIYEKMQILLNLTAEDVGFSWSTKILMAQIANCFVCAETNNEVEGIVKSTFHEGDKIWSAIKPHFSVIKKLAESLN